MPFIYCENYIDPTGNNLEHDKECIGKELNIVRMEMKYIIEQ